MSNANAMTPGDNGALQASLAAGSLQADQRGATDLNEAVQLAQQEQALVDAAGIGAQYQAGVQAEIEAVNMELGQLEQNLETEIEQQEARIQTSASNPPGIFASASAKQAYQAAQASQQAVLQRLHTKLEEVQEIHAGMGVHAPKVKELAETQFREKNPELAEQWDDLRAAQRGHEALMRKQEQDRRKQQSLGQNLGQALTLGLTHNR